MASSQTVKSAKAPENACLTHKVKLVTAKDFQEHSSVECIVVGPGESDFDIGSNQQASPFSSEPVADYYEEVIMPYPTHPEGAEISTESDQ